MRLAPRWWSWLLTAMLTMMAGTSRPSPARECAKRVQPGKPSAACSFDWFLLNQFDMSFDAFVTSSEALRRAAVAEYALEILFPTLLNPHGRLPRPVKAWTMRRYVSSINARCHVLGIPPPAWSKVNPTWTRVLRIAERTARAKPRKHTRLTAAGLRTILARAAGATVGSLHREFAVAVTVSWFFLLRPEEVSAGGKPGGLRSIRRDGVCFVMRAGTSDAYVWQECMPTEAEVVLLFLEGRKTDQSGYSTLMPRWRSGDALCPVRMLGAYVAAIGASVRPDAPLFPRATRVALGRFIRDEMALQGVAGGGDRSPRRGGAAHLRVHLEDDSRRKLCAAGGWTAKTSTAEEYAGLTIEATRYWSKLMIRPVTLL